MKYRIHRTNNLKHYNHYKIYGFDVTVLTGTNVNNMIYEGEYIRYYHYQAII